jgi:hypothetical protein
LQQKKTAVLACPANESNGIAVAPIPNGAAQLGGNIAVIPGYARQQLRAAISLLARATDCLQRKLEAAYQELEPLIAVDFPDGLGKDYTEIMSQLNRLGCRNNPFHV